MTATYPTAATSYTNPGPTDATGADVGGRTHDEFHADNNDDLEQVMAKLGSGASTASANTVLRGTGAGITAFGQIAAADIADNVITATQLGPDSVGASELADNAVATANILDANVTTAKLAADAATQCEVVYGTTVNPSTTATSGGTAPLIAEMQIAITATGGPVTVDFSSMFTHSLASTDITIFMKVDAVTTWGVRTVRSPATAGVGFLVAFAENFVAGDLAAGARTLGIYFYSTGGTLTAYADQRAFRVVEYKR